MRKTITFHAVLALLLVASYASPFDETRTHPAISEEAVFRSAPEGFSSLDEWLQLNLNFPNGINQDLNGQTVIRWVREGSTREDDGFRYFNHFHNPLRTWDNAGLRIFGLQIGNSSVRWGQNPKGTLWQDARQRYFEGLTSSDQSERETKLADTLELLGKLIHLVQDAAVPAHVRNDPHPPWNPDRLEGFMTNLHKENLDDFNAILQQTPKPYDKSILDRAPNPLAPVPVARIIDGSDPEQTEALPSAGTDQGMSEYSNANFLSGDTIFKNFTFPRIESIDLNFPLTVNNRRYYTKIADGETNFFLVAEGTFTERLLSLASGDKGFVLDPRVYQDYAQLLLPRAIGYSAGLIEYFFRGMIFVDVDTGQHPELLCAFDSGNNPRAVPLLVSNDTPDEDTGAGQMVFVVEYKIGNEHHFAVSSEESVSLSREPQEVTFGIPPISDNATGVNFWVVYRGPLGLEQMAVTVGGAGFGCIQ